MKYKLAIIIALMLIVPMVTATTIGVVKVNKCVELYQICQNCTYNNISIVLYPNRTIALPEVAMQSNNTYYNYTFCSTDAVGKYIVNGFGDLDGIKTTWTYDFEVNGSGFEFTNAVSIYYIATLGLLIFFFLLTIYSIPKLPNGNDTDDYGQLISINKLKYLRSVLYVLAWGLLLGITYSSGAIALSYLGNEMIGNLLFNIFRAMFALTIPGVFIYFIFIFVSVFRDKEMKKMLERGIDIQTP